MALQPWQGLAAGIAASTNATRRVADTIEKGNGMNWTRIANTSDLALAGVVVDMEVEINHGPQIASLILEDCDGHKVRITGDYNGLKLYVPTPVAAEED